MEQVIEKKKKNKPILIIFGIIVALIIISKLTMIYNKGYVERYVKFNYPDYRIIEKNYEYLDHFWSTWYDTEEDNFKSEIICNTMLRNNNTGMIVSIPLYHPPYRKYRDSEFGRKKVKKMVGEYEKYWYSINKLKETYNIELNVSNVEISESSSCDIYEITIYIKYKDNLKTDEIINTINNINTSLDIRNKNYVIAKEETYNNLYPWIESNKYIFIPKNLKKSKDDSNYDLYIESYHKENNQWEKRIPDYYLKENNTQTEKE